MRKHAPHIAFTGDAPNKAGTKGIVRGDPMGFGERGHPARSGRHLAGQPGLRPRGRVPLTRKLRQGLQSCVPGERGHPARSGRHLAGQPPAAWRMAWRWIFIPAFLAGRQDAGRSGPLPSEARAPLCHLHGHADDPFLSLPCNLFHPAWRPARGAWQSALIFPRPPSMKWFI
jgi:hypothetical protein